MLSNMETDKMKKKIWKFFLGFLAMVIAERLLNTFVFHMKADKIIPVGYIFLIVYSLYIWHGTKRLFFTKKPVQYNMQVYTVPEKEKGISYIFDRLIFDIRD